jgi:hypothetical protein
MRKNMLSVNACLCFHTWTLSLAISYHHTVKTILCDALSGVGLERAISSEIIATTALKSLSRAAINVRMRASPDENCDHVRLLLNLHALSKYMHRVLLQLVFRFLRD